MTPIDFTNELAPLIWTMEGFVLVAVAWLVGMFFAEQMRSGDLSSSDRYVASAPEPPAPAPSEESTSDDDRRMAA
jgi:hypothetical protein